MQNDLGWLIEDENRFPHRRWLRVAVRGREAHIEWTENISEALRFARRQDARAFAFLHPQYCTLATLIEHEFVVPDAVAGPVPSPEPRAGRFRFRA
jgi:hypothetical protein